MTLEDSFKPRQACPQTWRLLPLHTSLPPFYAPSPTILLTSQLIMAANTKYQAAPQRDSEEPSYTRAPPSYQAAGPSDGLFGAPRDEDDNVPDDFKVHSLQQVIPKHSPLTCATVRRDRRRSDPRHSHAIHPQGLRHPSRPAPPHPGRLLRLLLFHLLPALDPDQQLDDVGFTLRRHCLHAPHLLE